MQIIRLIKYIFIFIAIPTICHAAPVISSAVISDTISISGSDFGVKTTAAPVKWDNFEGGTTGNDLSGWSLYASETNSNPKYSSVHTRNGSQSAMCDFQTEGAYTSTFEILNGDWDVLFISFYYRPEYVNDGCYDNQPNRNFKILRVEGDSGTKTGDQVEGVPLFAVEHRSPNSGRTEVAVRAQYDPSLISDTFYEGDLGWEQGTWNKVEIYANVTSGSRTFKMWENGVERSPISTTLNNTWIPYMGEDSSSFDEIKFGFYYDTSASYGSCRAKVYFDDVYVDTTQAHIEIGNNVAFLSCTHKEIQIPLAWADTSITATINKGSFDSNDTLYLFVIDADGVASTGKAIQLQWGSKLNGNSSFTLGGNSTITFK